MRWPWQRRASGGESARSIALSGMVRRDAGKDERVSPELAFAQAYLAASGSRTRLAADTLSATLPDGTTQTYTANLHDSSGQAMVLVPGGEVLSSMLDDSNARSHIGALKLPRSHDPEGLVRDALTVASKTCGRCATGLERPEPVDADTCDACPLRATGNCFVVATLPRRLLLVTQSESKATSVELTYRVSVRDRAGRTEEVVRLALSAEGRHVEVLTPAQVRSTGVGATPENVAELARVAVARAEEALRPPLDAAAELWRMRSAEDYRRRQDALTAMGDRLRRERVDDEQSILRSLQRELAALADAFAVDAQATLESVYFVDAPVAEVIWRAPDGRDILFRVDAGRGSVAAECASCGRLTGRGSVCAQAHVSCAACGPRCGVCRGLHGTAQSSAIKKASRSKNEAQLLTLAHLDTLAQLTPRLWGSCAAWLLSREGYAVRDAEPDTTVWHATREGAEVIIVPLHAVPGMAITDEDVRGVARLARDSGAQGLLLGLAPASREVAALAEGSGVALWDRARLGECLVAVASEQVRAGSTTRGETKELVAEAIKSRALLLDTLTKAGATLGVTPSGERVVGSAALTAAISNLDTLRQSAERAFLVWDTLVADWLAMFPERVTPSGGLVIEADKKALSEVRERAAHLGRALGSVLEQVDRAPRHGELGYDAWCAGLIEECTARCSALRARVALVDPAEWEDARRARSSDAEVAAARADQAWRHAAARAAKAYAQVAQFAGER